MARVQRTDFKRYSSLSTATGLFCTSGHQIAKGLYTQLPLMSLKTVTVLFYKPSPVTIVISTPVEEGSYLNHENETGGQRRL